MLGLRGQKHGCILLGSRHNATVPLFPPWWDGIQQGIRQERNTLLCKNLFSEMFPPWGALMDKWGSGSSAVLPDVYFCHRRVHVPPCSMHLQPCGIRLGGLVVHVHHVLSRVAWWLVNQLCSSLLPDHKHADIHAVKPGHALSFVLSQFVRFLAPTSLWHFEDTRDIPRTPHLMCFFYSPSGAWCGVYCFYAYLWDSDLFRGVSFLFALLFSASVWVSQGKRA